MKSLFTIGLPLFICLLSFSNVSSQDLSEFFEKTTVFLEENVLEGKVAYKKIKSSPEQLNELLVLASTIEVQKTNSNGYRAFWINAYNLTVIQAVVAKYPIKSPLAVSGFFDKKTYLISGKKTTLNRIENKILRGQFNNDPRFHFALVCAGLGCPPIINKAYLPSTLETQLNKQTTLALNNTAFIKVNNKKKKVQFSQIFEWYTSDFTTGNKSLIDFVNIYRTTPIPGNYKPSYYSYDWTLNEIK
ncbi:MAG: DUF547 domain-containing protein [Flavobacteriaceae bacterium]|nr:DUF547 domain-containing protein [Flavobacteriaceae bacterium]